jgi:hypothetical protein
LERKDTLSERAVSSLSCRFLSSLLSRRHGGSFIHPSACLPGPVQKEDGSPNRSIEPNRTKQECALDQGRRGCDRTARGATSMTTEDRMGILSVGSCRHAPGTTRRDETDGEGRRIRPASYDIGANMNTCARAPAAQRGRTDRPSLVLGQDRSRSARGGQGAVRSVVEWFHAGIKTPTPSLGVTDNGWGSAMHATCGGATNPIREEDRRQSRLHPSQQGVHSFHPAFQFSSCSRSRPRPDTLSVSN